MVKVGEHGPELLNPRTGWMLPASRSHGSGGPTVVVNINHPIDAAGSGRAVQKVLDKYARVGGRSALAPA
jgi:hypothetical protein